jgi:hypothetical protein
MTETYSDREEEVQDSDGVNLVELLEREEADIHGEVKEFYDIK